jgi:hypothetical protein
MPETREKPASINRRMRQWFAKHPRTGVTARGLRNELHLPPDTAITARIREIRNHPREPMDIRCLRETRPNGVFYWYSFYPAKTVLCVAGEQLTLTPEKP